MGCSSTQSEPQTENTTDETTQISELDSLIQFQDSYPDDMQVAIMNTDQGEIDFVLFADQAPKAVENFVTHAKEGYYNGVTFHRVIDDFMIQTGDPTGTGSGGESIWGEPLKMNSVMNYIILEELSQWQIPVKIPMAVSSLLFRLIQWIRN